MALTPSRRASPDRHGGKGPLAGERSAAGTPAAVDPEALARAARAGDREAFERLVIHFQDDVIHTARYFLGGIEDAEDAAQEAFIRAFRGIADFKGESSFRTWLLRIVINAARSHAARARALKRSAAVISLSAESGPGGERLEGAIADGNPGDAPPERAMRAELREAIDRAIAALDPESRAVLVLRDIAGESYQSIAAALSLPLGTVKSRVHRARLEVQERLKRWGLP